MKRIWFNIKKRFKSFRLYLKQHRGARIMLIIGTIILIFGIIQFVAGQQQQAKKQAKIDREAAAEIKKNNGSDDASLGTYDAEQLELRKKYGTPPKGMALDSDGNYIARGDMKMSAENVAYAYMQAVSKVDFKQVEKYASSSKVIKYSNRYNSGKDSEYSAADDFRFYVYKDVLKSIQNLGVKDSVHYANNKVIITFKVKSIDLSYKDFWRPDKDTIFADLYSTKTKENDRAKISRYLYSYLKSYYDSEKVATYTDTISLTLQKTQASGWLVTDDSSVSNLGQYTDNDPNNGPIGIIQSEFESYYDEQQNSWNNDGTTDNTKTTDADASQSQENATSDSSSATTTSGRDQNFENLEGYTGDSDDYVANPFGH